MQPAFLFPNIFLILHNDYINFKAILSFFILI